jgi:hypothetical protein
VYFPAGSDPLASGQAIQACAESLTGVVVSVGSAQEANQVRDALASSGRPATTARPLVVWRSDTNQMFVSTGGAFEEFAPKPLVGSVTWGTPDIYQMTADYEPLGGWVEQYSDGSAPVSEDGGVFTILEPGLWMVQAQIGLRSDQGSASWGNCHLRIAVNGDWARWAWVPDDVSGHDVPLQATLTRRLYAGDEVQLLVCVNGSAAAETYGDVQATSVTFTRMSS